MAYPDLGKLNRLVRDLDLYVHQQYEVRARGLRPALRRAEQALARAVRELRRLPPDAAFARREPSALEAIRRLRPGGPRRLWTSFDAERYRDRLEGALLARMAGCTLGAIVEGWSVQDMADWAATIGDAFPPTDYWSKARSPERLRYGTSRCEEYTRSGMHGVPADDDVAYTLLGLLIVEEFGPDFTTADVGRSWVKRLPIACTAEQVALENLKAGVPAARAAEVDNPYQHWIGADIRCDPWAYLAPGWPERAADMAWRDAFLSHRRNGIYGAMFFAAAISAAFAVDSAEEALRVGLTEIPRDCALAADVRWALETAPSLKDCRAARAAVDERFKGMSHVHTNNNACLTIFGLLLGGRDVTRVLGETCAMGLDNDCTTATAGSLVGALVGRAGVPDHWVRPFGDRVITYLRPMRRFGIRSLLHRFERQARRVFAG